MTAKNVVLIAGAHGVSGAPQYNTEAEYRTLKSTGFLGARPAHVLESSISQSILLNPTDVRQELETTENITTLSSALVLKDQWPLKNRKPMSPS